MPRSCLCAGEGVPVVQWGWAGLWEGSWAHPARCFLSSWPWLSRGARGLASSWMGEELGSVQVVQGSSREPS